MKCAITGHDQGLGKFFYEHFESLGYSCFGFSRRTGVDISKHRDLIVAECKGVDVFINNACNKDDSQLELMIDMLYECKYMIICGSVSGDFPDVFGDDGYARGKERLADACRYLTTVDDEKMAKILYLDLCVLDHSIINNDNPKDFGSDWAVPPEHIVSAVNYWFSNPLITRIEWNQKITPYLEKELLRTYPDTSVTAISKIKEKVQYYLNFNR